MGEKPDWGNALPLTRLYVVCEGLTEVNLVRDILAPHIEQRWAERIAVPKAPNLRGSGTFLQLEKVDQEPPWE